MSDHLERERLYEGIRTPPERQPPASPVPEVEKARPTRLIRWMEWTALIIAVVAIGVFAVWLAGRGGDDAGVTPEQGELTEALPAPDALDRWMANQSQAVQVPDALDRWMANHT